MIKVAVTQFIDLDDKTVEEVFRKRLSELKAGRWIDDRGRFMEEVYTSHRFDTEVDGGATHPDYVMVAAIQNLERVLDERKKAHEQRHSRL